MCIVLYEAGLKNWHFFLVFSLLNVGCIYTNKILNNLCKLCFDFKDNNTCLQHS